MQLIDIQLSLRGGSRLKEDSYGNASVLTKSISSLR